MLQIKPITIKDTWEKFLLASDQANFLQSWAWGETHLDLHHQIFRLGLYKNNQLIGISLLIKLRARRGTYFECPGGPVLNWSNREQVGFFFNYLKQLALTESASFIRIRPNITFAPQLKLVKAPMHLHAEHTWVLDLNQSEEEILAKMRKTTRYLIKKAQKLGVKIIVSESDKDIDILSKLQQETVKRQHFVPFSREYFLSQFKAFKVDKKIKILKAVYQGQVLSIAMIIFYGPEAVYHYSGSSNERRDIPASYLLQWQAIKLAQASGCSRYNFWGIAPTNNPRHRFYGVTVFKTGFGGYAVNYFPAHDLPLRWSYWLTYIFETIRRLFRHL